jgi:TetR/AcrR family transcriptional repressor of nem operon
MTRTLKDPEVRRNEIIDVAQALFLSKGYESTSVQDVLDGAGIAKGTFYHYFGSKMELLDALVARLADSTFAAVEPIVQDENMSAPQKIHAYFDAIMQWKTENRRFFMDIGRVIYQDDNAIYREKMLRAARKQIGAFFTVIIKQGLEEGVFSTQYPPEMSQIVYTVMLSMSESMMYLLLDEAYEGDMIADFERTVRAHEFAIARILGYGGELNLVDMDAMKLWVEVAASSKPSPVQRAGTSNGAHL